MAWRPGGKLPIAALALMAPAALLAAIGLVCVWADSPRDGPRQLLYAALGIGLALLIQVVNYQRLGRWAWGIYLLSLLGVGYTLLAARISLPAPFPKVPLINGAQLWIDLGFMSFQPAEMAKIGFVMVLARQLRFGGAAGGLKRLIAPSLLALAPVLMILKQPDLGTALVFIPTLLGVIFVAGGRLRHLGAIVLVGVVLLPVVWLAGADLPFFRHLPNLVRDYQRARVHALLSDDPATLQAAGFQQHATLMALGSGGVSGKGLGMLPISRRVPESHNDMILAVVGEQFGLLGTLAVLLGYLGLALAGGYIAAATRDPFARLLAAGLVLLLVSQAFLNLLVAVRLMPVTGVTLPLVSYGGTSLLASFAALGLLANIASRRPLVVARESFGG